MDTLTDRSRLFSDWAIALFKSLIKREGKPNDINGIDEAGGGVGGKVDDEIKRSPSSHFIENKDSLQRS